MATRRRFSNGCELTPVDPWNDDLGASPMSDSRTADITVLRNIPQDVAQRLSSSLKPAGTRLDAINRSTVLFRRC